MKYLMKYADWCEALDACTENGIYFRRILADCKCGSTPGLKVEKNIYACCDLCYEGSAFFEQVSFSEFKKQNGLKYEQTNG